MVAVGKLGFIEEYHGTNISFAAVSIFLFLYQIHSAASPISVTYINQSVSLLAEGLS